MTKLVYLIVYLGIFCLNVAFAIRRGEISLNLFRYVLRVVGMQQSVTGNFKPVVMQFIYSYAYVLVNQ